MSIRSALTATALSAAALLAALPAPAATVVSLEFDDTHQNQYQVGQMVLDRGMRATFFVLSPRIGRTGYMTLSQLHELQAAGNEIGGHTLDHVDLTTVTAAEAERQICEDRAALVNAGFDVTSFAYPFGAYNETVRSIAARCGYENARTVGGIGCTGCASAETLPPADRYATRTRASVKTDTTLAALQGYVTAAEESGGGWVQLVFHHVCDGSTCPSLSVNTSTLTAFLDWLAPRASTGTVVRTVREALDTEPPEVAITSPGNLAVVLGTVTVRAQATDNAGVAEVRFYANNRLIGTSSTAPYQVEWDSRRDGLGIHRLHAEATDVAGNTARSATVSVVAASL